MYVCLKAVTIGKMRFHAIPKYLNSWLNLKIIFVKSKQEGSHCYTKKTHKFQFYLR